VPRIYDDNGVSIYRKGLRSLPDRETQTERDKRVAEQIRKRAKRERDMARYRARRVKAQAHAQE
jgi:hypothetical protein